MFPFPFLNTFCAVPPPKCEEGELDTFDSEKIKRKFTDIFGMKIRPPSEFSWRSSQISG